MQLLFALVVAFHPGTAPEPSAAATVRAVEDPKDLADAEAYEALQKEFTARWSAYDEALRAAQKQGLPRESWPIGPQREFHDRYDAFARAGHPRALRWCIQFADATGLAGEELRQRKLSLYGEIVKRYSDEEWIGEVLRDARTEVRRGVLSADDVEAICVGVSTASTKPETRAAALYNAGLALAASDKPGHVARGEAWLDKVVAEHATSEAAARAKTKLFQLRNLQVGKVAPDFVTTDVDGVEFKLSDYRGKVVVLDFWGFW